VTGTAHQGLTLTASNGGWSPAATSYSYQWEHATPGSNKWTEISDATSSSYVPAASDVGDSLRVLVTGSDKSGPGAAFSTATATVPSGAPASTAAPSVTGTLRGGQALTVSNGSWNPSATSYAYQWQRSTTTGGPWTAITGATSSTYVPGSADLNAYLRVLVTATNANGQASATSAQAGPINGEPNNTAVPTIAGTARQGSTLTASNGTWNPVATSYAYQWQRSAAVRAARTLPEGRSRAARARRRPHRSEASRDRAAAVGRAARERLWPRVSRRLDARSGRGEGSSSVTLSPHASSARPASMAASVGESERISAVSSRASYSSIGLTAAAGLPLRVTST